MRPKDEKYWDDYRTTPKAFIRLEKGQELWQSRFGKLTSMRLFTSKDADLRGSLESYRGRLKTAIDPIEAGLAIHSIRRRGFRRLGARQTSASTSSTSVSFW